jgi:hypothetical protein
MSKKRLPGSLVTEEPVVFGDNVYTARRNAGEYRWQVFCEGMLAPAGYLEAVYQPTETGDNGGWQLAVFDRDNRPVGERGKRAAPGTVPAVNSYNNALSWIDAWLKQAEQKLAEEAEREQGEGNSNAGH